MNGFLVKKQYARKQYSKFGVLADLKAKDTLSPRNTGIVYYQFLDLSRFFIIKLSS